jgi:hypothetical protein
MPGTYTFTLVFQVPPNTPSGTTLTNSIGTVFAMGNVQVFVNQNPATVTVASATPTSTATATATPTPTATATPVASATPTRTATPSATQIATATATSTSTATATSTSAVIGTPTSTGTVTATVTPTGVSTRTATPAGTVARASATVTSSPSVSSCNNIGAVCHTDLTLSGVPGATSGTAPFVPGPIQVGPCLPTGRDNCIEFRTVGSFQVTGVLAGLATGAQVTLRIPVVNTQGAPVGTRELACSTADATGRARCSGIVGGSGEAPLVGGVVQALVASGAPEVALVAPLLPPMPPLVLPPPPPVLLPPPASAPPSLLALGRGVAPEVPVIPEADSLLLLVLGLTALGWVARPWRRPH